MTCAAIGLILSISNSIQPQLENLTEDEEAILN
jgi:hypothetical protein